MNRIIYYYQTLIGLKDLIKRKIYPTHIILSSIHFGLDKNNLPYIHINDNRPNNEMFNKVWDELELLNRNGVKIMVMMGGAGGAYNDLFSNYKIYYNKLIEFMKSKTFISGIDLDIEEGVNINDIKNLINDINNDMGEKFIITMAPLGGSLSGDYPGMGGFIYKDLYKSKEGKRINWFNCQVYGDYSLDTIDNIVANGYPADKVVMGMIFNEFPNFQNCLDVINKIKKKYDNMGGVFVWEYYAAPSLDNTGPGSWCKEIKEILN